MKNDNKYMTIRVPVTSPLKQDTFRVKLNKLAYEEKITDNKGEIFRFHAHALKNRIKALEEENKQLKGQFQKLHG